MTNFTSRSAIECYQACPRYRFNQYYLNGTGVVPKQSSIYLVTGGAIHKGIEHLLNRVRISLIPNVELAVGEALEEYDKNCKDQGLRGKGIITDRQQEFTYGEQRALTEGLIRAWYLRELPEIQKKFRVIGVEREIDPLPFEGEVMFQAKIDAEFQELETGNFINYSLKSVKGWGEREENSYKNDLQGITETWAVEEDWKRYKDRWIKTVEDLEMLQDYHVNSSNMNIVKMTAYLRNKIPEDKKLSGIRFCFLIKGVRKKPDFYGNDPEALYITYNPLIRGYKNITPSGVAYAHSWNYPNAENKSGKSVLGKGWEPFNIWESGVSIKDWVNALAVGEVQPECGDVVKGQVVTPLEYYRNEREIEEGIREIQLQEFKIADTLKGLEYYNKIHNTKDAEQLMAGTFKHVRSHCEFHFGGACGYKSLCWSPEVMDNPVESGLYQIRVPHHEAEKKQLEGKG